MDSLPLSHQGNHSWKELSTIQKILKLAKGNKYIGIFWKWGSFIYNRMEHLYGKKEALECTYTIDKEYMYWQKIAYVHYDLNSPEAFIESSFLSPSYRHRSFIFSSCLQTCLELFFTMFRLFSSHCHQLITTELHFTNRNGLQSQLGLAMPSKRIIKRMSFF